MSNATIAIQGFGNVGRHAAKHLNEMGAKIVATSGAQGGIARMGGLDIETLWDEIAQGRIRSVVEAEVPHDSVSNHELLELDVDVLIPAAIEGVVTKENASQIKARLVVEAANLPTTAEADEILKQRDVIVVPDLLANAGGVIVSYLEWVQNRQCGRWPEERVIRELEDTLKRGVAARPSTRCRRKRFLSRGELLDCGRTRQVRHHHAGVLSRDVIDRPFATTRILGVGRCSNRLGDPVVQDRRTVSDSVVLRRDAGHVVSTIA